VEKLVAQIVEKFGTKNAFLIIPCERTPNALVIFPKAD
jgi:hypothetical protein